MLTLYCTILLVAAIITVINSHQLYTYINLYRKLRSLSESYVMRVVGAESIGSGRSKATRGLIVMIAEHNGRKYKECMLRTEKNAVPIGTEFRGFANKKGYFCFGNAFSGVMCMIITHAVIGAAYLAVIAYMGVLVSEAI